MTSNDLCPTCNKPLSSGIGGFVTRLIEVCHCRTGELEQIQTIRICALCGKRIRESSGTFTQWIFGEGRCECERPEAIETPVDNFVMPSFVGFHKDDEETELEVEPENFPLERYKPIGELGRGAAGQVFLCRDRLLGKRVAVKTLLNLDAEQLVAFQDEARATARLDHTNIIRVLDFGATEGGTPYMVMDYIPGVSLERFIATRGTLDEELARHVFVKLALALQYSHEQGIFHRDIKPNNILLFESEDGIDASIIDFGISKVKESSGFVTSYQNRTLAGTPTYMSPDPVRGDSYDARSEIYCLGCVMFESLTGEPPFVGETAMETLGLHANEEPLSVQEYNQDLSDNIANIVATCLEKEKANRFDSMAELASNLDNQSDRLFDYEQEDESHYISKNTGTNPDDKKVFINFGVMALGILVVVGFLFNRYFDFEQYTNEVTTIASKNSVLRTENQVVLVDKEALIEPFSANGLSGYKLTFRRRVVDQKVIESFAKKHSILALVMTDCFVSNSATESIARLDKLQELSLLKPTFKEEDLQERLFSNSLKKIVLSGDFTAKVFDCLANLPDLQSAKIERDAFSKNVIISASDLQKFARLKLLNSLSVSNMMIEPDGLKVLSHMNGLKTLNINASVFSEAQLKVLPEFSTLNSFGLYNAKVDSPEFFSVLTRSAQLDEVVLSNCVLADQSQKSLSKITKFKSLYLDRSKTNILKDAMKLRLKAIALISGTSAESPELKRFCQRNKTGSGSTVLTLNLYRTSGPPPKTRMLGF